MDKPQTVAQETLGSRWEGQTRMPSPHRHLLYPTPSPGLTLPTVTLPPSSGSPGPRWCRDLRFPSCSWAGWAQRAPLSAPLHPGRPPVLHGRQKTVKYTQGCSWGHVAGCIQHRPTPPPHSAILRRIVGQLSANAASQL